MNQIPAVQREESNIKLLRARRNVYAEVNRLIVLQLSLTVLLPAIGAFMAIVLPQLRPFVAAGILGVIVLDVTYLDQLQRKLLKTGAKLQEQFDCAVLDLPWDTFTVGPPVDPEDIHEEATAYVRRGGTDAELIDWYPIAAGSAELKFGRLICQRTNLWYDSKLRRHYGRAVLSAAIGLIVILLIAGLIAELPLTEFFDTVVPPAAPILIWSIREFLRQRETADHLDQIRAEAMALWQRAKDGQCDDRECRARSREFQNAIFTRRSTSPLIFSKLYRKRRKDLEDQMEEGAAVWLRELDTDVRPVATR